MKSSKRAYLFLILYCISWQAIAAPFISTTPSSLGVLLSTVALFVSSSIAAPISQPNGYNNNNGIQSKKDFIAPTVLGLSCNSPERHPSGSHHNVPDIVVSPNLNGDIDDQLVASSRILKRGSWISPTVSDLPSWSNTWDSVTSSVSNVVSSAKSWWYGDGNSPATASAPVAIIEPDMPSLSAPSQHGLWTKVTDWWNGNSADITTSPTASVPSEQVNGNGFLSGLRNWWNGQTTSTPDVALLDVSTPDIPVPNFDTPLNAIEIPTPGIIIPDGWMENSFSEMALPEIVPPEISLPEILPPTISPPELPVEEILPASDPIADELLDWHNTYNPDLWESVPNEPIENLDENVAAPQVMTDLQNSNEADAQENTYNFDLWESVHNEPVENNLVDNAPTPQVMTDQQNVYDEGVQESITAEVEEYHLDNDVVTPQEFSDWSRFYDPDLGESISTDISQQVTAANPSLIDETLPATSAPAPKSLDTVQSSPQAEIIDTHLEVSSETAPDTSNSHPIIQASQDSVAEELADWKNSFNPDLWESDQTDISQQVAAVPNLIDEPLPMISVPTSDSSAAVLSSPQSDISTSSDINLETPSKPASDTFVSTPVIVEASQDAVAEEFVDWVNFYDPTLWDSDPIDVSLQVSSNSDPMPIVEAPRDKGKGREILRDDPAVTDNVVPLTAIRVPKDGIRAPPPSFAQYDRLGNIYDFAGPSRTPDVPHDSLAGLRSYLSDSKEVEGLRAGPVSVPEDEGPAEYVYEGERIPNIEGYRDSFAGLQILRGPWDGLRAPQNSISDDTGLNSADQKIVTEEPESMELTNSLPIADELLDWRDFYDGDWSESPLVESNYDIQVPAEDSPVELSTMLQQPTINAVLTDPEEPEKSQPSIYVSDDTGFTLGQNTIFEEPEIMEPFDLSSVPEEFLNWRNLYDPDLIESPSVGSHTGPDDSVENALLGVPTVSEPSLDYQPVLEEPQSSLPSNDISQDGLFMLDRNVLFTEPEIMDATEFSPIPEGLSNWRDLQDPNWRESPPAGPRTDFDSSAENVLITIPSNTENPSFQIPQLVAEVLPDNEVPLNSIMVSEETDTMLSSDLSAIPEELTNWRDFYNPDRMESLPLDSSIDFEVHPHNSPMEVPPVVEQPVAEVGPVQSTPVVEVTEALELNPRPNNVDVSHSNLSPISPEQPDLQDQQNPAVWTPEPMFQEDMHYLDMAPISQELQDWQNHFDPDLWGPEPIVLSADFEEAAVPPSTELPIISQDPEVKVGSVDVPTLLEESVATTPEPMIETPTDLGSVSSFSVLQEMPVLGPTVPEVEVLVKPLSSTPMTKELPHDNLYGNVPENLYRSETSRTRPHFNTKIRKCNPIRQGLMGYEIDFDCIGDDVLLPEELNDWRDSLDPKLWSSESFPST
ncbi:hypothetical protein BZA77DRAFT_370263 [Pyronema omphalodes]|nr:hypothetical protein BZA77DRAFT_370263 [Pyronema omphalodes]